MAQPVLPLSAVVEAGGQSSVGPANYLLLETAALRLVLAQGFLRQHLQSRPKRARKTRKQTGMARHQGITTQRHLNDYRSSNATPRAAQLCDVLFLGGKAQRHHGTKAQGYDFIRGRMPVWTYFEILTVFLRKAQKAEQHKGTLMSIALHMQLDEMPTACWDLLCKSCFSRGQGTEAQ